MVNSYQFVSESVINSYREKLDQYSDEKIISSIIKMSQRGRGSSSSKTYDEIREGICSFNIILNERSLIAPVFRPFRKNTNRIGLNDEEKLLSLDRQVIDLHYLYIQHKSRVNPSDSEFKSLFTNEKFSFELAAEFALKEWKCGHKATESLKLSDSIQEELSILRSRVIADRYRYVEKKISEIEIDLNNLCDTPSSRLKPESVPLRTEEYRCLKYARGSIKEAVRFFTLRGNLPEVDERGQAACVKRFQARKTWFESRLGHNNWS
ncbi:MAG: hypothetical protein AB2729_06400 [Candidatus Thiodiazotropha taylori]